MTKLHLSSDIPVWRLRVLAEPEFGPSTVPSHPSSPTAYLTDAVRILSEYDLPLPDPEQLNLIVRSALAVQCLYFAACLHHPDKVGLHEVFEMFLLACVTCAHETENLCPSLKYD
jgi:hypothetical protein